MIHKIPILSRPVVDVNGGFRDLEDVATFQTIDIEYSEGVGIIATIHEKSNEFMVKHGNTPEVIYIDCESYLKLKYYYEFEYTQKRYIPVSNVPTTNQLEIMGMKLQVVPFKKCIKVGYADPEKEAIRYLSERQNS